MSNKPHEETPMTTQMTREQLAETEIRTECSRLADELVRLNNLAAVYQDAEITQSGTRQQANAVAVSARCATEMLRRMLSDAEQRATDAEIDIATLSE
jgi:hypothetical protein